MCFIVSESYSRCLASSDGWTLLFQGNLVINVDPTVQEDHYAVAVEVRDHLGKLIFFTSS